MEEFIAARVDRMNWLEGVEVYRPEGVNIESHSVSLFGDSDNDSLSCLPLVTCRLVETVRFAGETERPLYDRGGERKGSL